MKEKVMIDRKKAVIVCVVVGLIAMVAAGIAGMTSISKKEAAVESYDPLNYGPGQQAECVISDIKSDADKDSSLKSVSDMVKASVSYTDYSKQSDFTDDISRDKILSSTAAYNHYGKTYFRFGNSRSYGCTSDKNKTYIESEWGMHIQTDGSEVKCTPYNNRLKGVEVKSVEFWEWGENPRSLTTVSNAAWDKKICFDLSKCNNGIYLVRLYISGGDVVLQTLDCELLYMNSNAYTCCSVARNADEPGQISMRLRELHKWTDKLKPNEYMSLEGLTYPSSGEKGIVNNVNDIAKFSHTLIKDEWSDEYKVYAFTDWLINNVAYDKWRTEKNNSHSRAYTYECYTKPEYFMWTNHVGVCWDYTNALAIMCRDNGIAATSIDTERHTWNLIYINGQWESIDLCSINKFYSYDKVPNKNNWESRYNYDWSDYAVYPDRLIYDVVSTNDQMWTYERALGIK